MVDVVLSATPLKGIAFCLLAEVIDCELLSDAGWDFLLIFPFAYLDF